MKIRHILLLITCVSVLSACTQSIIRSQIMRVAKPWTITLLVTGNGSNATMKVKTPPMRGCRSEKEGCMIFAKGESGKITFDMSGNDSGWHIKELKICKGTAQPSPPDASCPIGVNALDFYVLHSDGNAKIPNFDHGYIRWDYADAIKTFELHDRNFLDQKYYYQVVACDASSNCIIADPPLDNEGLH